MFGSSEIRKRLTLVGRIFFNGFCIFDVKQSYIQKLESLFRLYKKNIFR